MGAGLLPAINLHGSGTLSRYQTGALWCHSSLTLGSPRFHCRPIIFFHEGRLIINFGNALLGSASHSRSTNLPQLTSLQLDALDAIEAIAKATQLEMETQAGDIHLVNNLAILHRRQGFVDGSSSMEKRNLVRIRLLETDKGWDIPPELLQEWTQASFYPSHHGSGMLSPCRTGISLYGTQDPGRG
ncbi:hypothetical protein E4U59_003817 [Claviceps monticola]|nr:hypothetical protein E4U59_003817 [Claviceps monticola]